MKEFDRTNHWNNIYSTKGLTEVSWYQANPELSLDLIEKAGISKDSKIIDIGGGDGLFVDKLLDLGYTDITVLDISEKAIQRAKDRLAERATKVNWIVSDVIDFVPHRKYDLWHDRAAFHFLNDSNEINKYSQLAADALSPGATLILATFSTKGPKKCSGIDIQQYDEASLRSLFESSFAERHFILRDHKTPFDTLQNFLFAVFERRS